MVSPYLLARAAGGIAVGVAGVSAMRRRQPGDTSVEDRSLPSVSKPPGEDLHGRNLRKVDLTGVDLVGADLSRCRLDAVDLSGRDLRGADLRAAMLDGANLRDADLEDAVLDWASLRSADLSGARLARASVIEADFSNARLVGTHLRGCRTPHGALWRGAESDGSTEWPEQFDPLIAGIRPVREA